MSRKHLVLAFLSAFCLCATGELLADPPIGPSECTNDPLLQSGDQWNLDGPNGIGCPQDWNYVQGHNVVIAFIGDGVQYTRDEFRGKFAGGYNFQNPGEPPLPFP